MFEEIAKKLNRNVWMLFVCLWLLTACLGGGSGIESNLKDKTWVLTAYNGIQPIEGRIPTIQFDDSQVSGNASCNHYGGSYQVKGDQIRFDNLFNTEMACAEPEGVMEQERIYLELLRSANRFEVQDGMLTIFVDSQNGEFAVSRADAMS